MQNKDNTKMTTNSSIDWMSITFPSSTKPELMLPTDFEYRYEEIKSPIPVYRTAFLVHPIGAKVLLGQERFGRHVIYSGKSMQKLRDFEVDLPELWRHFQQSQGKLSRIDLAVDVWGEKEFTPAKVQERFFAGDCVTGFKRNKSISEDEKVETFYFGSLKSRVAKCRVYDKAIEQGLPDLIWTRLEYEKRKNAQNWGNALFSDGKSIKGLIRQVVDFPSWSTWLDIFNSEIESIPRQITDMPSDTEQSWSWLLNSVAPAMAKVIVHDKTFIPDKLNIQDTDTMTIFNRVVEGLVKSQLHKLKSDEVSLKNTLE